MTCKELVPSKTIMEDEYCPPFNDSYGNYHAGFMCPKRLRLYLPTERYCCGNITNKYCCHDMTKSINNHTIAWAHVYWGESWPIFAFLGFALLLALLSPFMKPHQRSVVMA